MKMHMGLPKEVVSLDCTPLEDQDLASQLVLQVLELGEMGADSVLSNPILGQFLEFNTTNFLWHSHIEIALQDKPVNITIPKSTNASM